MQNRNDYPDISVIVPVYNVEKYIERCLLSLINQDCTCNYEIITVNDGTKDNSMQIVRRLAASYDKIRIVEKENGGLASARNAGLAQAHGEFVAFVDSDDFVSESYISRLYDTAVNTGADIVCCNYKNTDESGEHGFENPLSHTCGVFSGRSALKGILADITIRSYVWNKLYRRSLFTDNNIVFPLGMTFEDFAIMPQLMYHSKKVAFIKDTLYFYVHRHGSITGTMKKSTIEDYIRAYAMIRRFLESKNIFESNRVIYYFLRKKISVTAFGMLLRCWYGDRKNTRVIASYAKIRKFLKIYSSDKYYYTSQRNLEKLFVYE